VRRMRLVPAQFSGYRDRSSRPKAGLSPLATPETSSPQRKAIRESRIARPIGWKSLRRCMRFVARIVRTLCRRHDCFHHPIPHHTPANRRAAPSAVRKMINQHLPRGHEEGMQSAHRKIEFGSTKPEILMHFVPGFLVFTLVKSGVWEGLLSLQSTHDAGRVEVERAERHECLARSVKLASLVRCGCSSRHKP
jgi:hypothetical protein